jgi:acetoin:2,6-dichlorophenolindophenol oxidoreductase subunit beta
VRKTGRVVVTDESHDQAGIAAGIAAILADVAWDALKAPVKRVSTVHTPVPYARTLEEAITPTPERIVATVRALVSYQSSRH